MICMAWAMCYTYAMGYTGIQKRQYQIEWLQRRRTDWLEANGPCVKCGSQADLEVDHIDRASKVSHRLWGWTAERREAELAKCQVLCRNCHIEKTRAENERPLVHGTRSAYAYKGCRCDDCRRAQADYMKTWKLTREQGHA